MKIKKSSISLNREFGVNKIMNIHGIRIYICNAGPFPVAML